MITDADKNFPGSSFSANTEAHRHSFFAGIIYNGNQVQLTNTINSVLRQKSSGLNVAISIFYGPGQVPQPIASSGIVWIPFRQKEDFFKTIVHEIELSTADYCTIAWNGEELFDGAFESACQIFNKYAEVNWLTGIQTLRTESGFNIALGSTAIRRWSYQLYERNLYKNSGRYIAPASTFWRKSIWKSISPQLYFISQNDFCEDLWVAFFKTQKLYTCKIYFSTVANYDKLNKHSFKQPNYSELIEDSVLNRVKEFFFINNVPYLRLFYRSAIGFAPVIRFDLNTQSFFLSPY